MYIILRSRTLKINSWYYQLSYYCCSYWHWKWNILIYVSNLVKKTDYNTKIIEIQNKITTNYDHDKHVTTQEFDKLTSENFTAKLKQVNLASKNDIAKFVKKSLGNKLKSFRSNKIELNELSKKVKAISTKGLKKIW